MSKVQKHSQSRNRRKPKSRRRNRIEVSAGLIFHKGKLLIAQRHAHDHLGGFWEFPGGKREIGETFQQCLMRELREEIGVIVEVGEMLESISHNYPTTTIHLRFFACRLISGNPTPIDCAALKWISQDELAHHEFPPADARLLKKLGFATELWE